MINEGIDRTIPEPKERRQVVSVPPGEVGQVGEGDSVVVVAEEAG